MRKGRGRIVVLSKNSSSLFGYASTLNELGYYSLSLCNHVWEVVDLLEAGKRFEYLVFDAFELEIDARPLQEIARHCAIFSIIAVADVNSLQRQGLILWARTHEIPLRGVLQTPLRPPELQELIGGQSHLLNPHCL